jgi:hypothetical protein
MRSVIELFRSERRRLEIVGSTGLGNEIALALAEYNTQDIENYSIVSGGKRIGRRTERTQVRGREITKVFYFVDVPIAFDINSRNGIEIEGVNARFYTSDLGTNFEYLADANREDILRFKREIPHRVNFDNIAHSSKV